LRWLAAFEARRQSGFEQKRWELPQRGSRRCFSLQCRHLNVDLELIGEFRTSHSDRLCTPAGQKKIMSSQFPKKSAKKTQEEEFC
jgi:hypothetical protein